MYETMHHISCCTCRQSPKRNPTAPWSPGRGGERRCNLFYWQPFSSIFLQFLKCGFHLLENVLQVQSFLLAAVSPFLANILSQAGTSFYPFISPFHNSCKKLHFFTFLPSRHLFSLHLNPILLWVPSLLPHHLPGWFFNLSFLINSLPVFFLLSFSCSLSTTSLFFPSSFVKFLSITSPG